MAILNHAHQLSNRLENFINMDFKVDNEIRLPDLIFDARFHPLNESLIAVGTISGHVHLIESGQVKSRIRKHHKGSSIRKVRFTKDGRMVTIAKTVKIHDLVSEQTTHTLRRDDGKLSTFYSLMPFGNNIISAGDDDGGIFVWDVRTPDKAIYSSYDCEQYISDIDGKYEARKLIACTSGEGTLTAYDMRAKKMIEPQSELFEAGFQCMRFVDDNKKVVIGAEDGSLYVFNQNEWAHTSGKFAISSDLQNRGKCSIDCIEKLPDSSIFLAGCSDGKIRAFTLWPHQILCEKSFCKRASLESVHINPIEGSKQFVVSGENYLNIVSFEEKIDTESDADIEMCVETAIDANNAGDDENNKQKKKSLADVSKFKPQTEDYLNIFN